MQNQKLTSQLAKSPQTQIATELSPTPSASQTTIVQSLPSPKVKTLKDVQDALIANTNIKDHSAILPLLKTDTVNFIVMSSGCCPPKTAKDALDSLNYIDDGIPFDFEQNSTLVKTLKSKNERLTNAFIGLSKNKEQLVAYTIDDKNQVTQIEVSASYKFYTQ